MGQQVEDETRAALDNIMITLQSDCVLAIKLHRSISTWSKDAASGDAQAEFLIGIIKNFNNLLVTMQKL